MIEEFSWEKEDDRSTLEMEETEQQEIVYITNLEDVYEKTVQNCMMKKAQTKKPAARNRRVEEPSPNDLNHVFEVYKESGSDVDYIEDSLKG